MRSSFLSLVALRVQPRCIHTPPGKGGCGLAMGAPIGWPCERDEQRPSATPTAGAMGHRPSTGGALRDERAVGAGPEARGHASSQFGEPHPLQDLGLRTLARGPRQEPAAGVSAATLLPLPLPLATSRHRERRKRGAPGDRDHFLGRAGQPWSWPWRQASPRAVAVEQSKAPGSENP
jgi:hypothetical protein